MKKFDSCVGGIDICAEDGEINWNNIKTAKTLFAMIKSTEGAEDDSPLPCYVDPLFESNVKNAYMYGLRVGAYHYLTAESIEEARSQAEFFVETIRKVGVMINFYCGVVVTEYDTIEDTSLYIDIFCGIVSAAGYRPIVYAPTDILRKFRSTEYDLWFPCTEKEFSSLPPIVKKRIALCQYRSADIRGMNNTFYRSVLIKQQVLDKGMFNSSPVRYPNRKRKKQDDLEANEWAVRHGILQSEDGIFRMDEVIEREEIITMLKRFVDMWRGAYD